MNYSFCIADTSLHSVIKLHFIGLSENLSKLYYLILHNFKQGLINET